MDIVLKGLGQVQVDDMADALNVQPSAGHIRGDQDQHIALGEVPEGTLPLALAEATMKGSCSQSRQPQQLCHLCATSLSWTTQVLAERVLKYHKILRGCRPYHDDGECFPGARNHRRVLYATAHTILSQ